MNASARFPWNKAYKSDDPALQKIQDDDDALSILQEISDELDQLASYTEFSDIQDSIGILCDKLSEIWNNSNDSTITARTFCSFIQIVDKNMIKLFNKILNSVDILVNGKKTVKAIISVCQSYIQSISSMCDPNQIDGRMWKTQKFSPPNITPFQKILSRFYIFVRVLSDLSLLLTASEQQQINFLSIVSDVNKLLPEHLLPILPRLWDSHFLLYETKLVQAERLAALKLHDQLLSNSHSPEAILQAFKSHETLLSRSVAVSELGHELSQALSFVTSEINRTNEEVSSLDAVQKPVMNLVWFQQKKVLFEDYLKFTKSLPNSQSIQNDLITLLTSLKSFGSEQMKAWVSDITSKLNDTIKVPTDGNLVDFGSHTEGLVKVRFHDDLLVFLEEVRLLSSVKISVPQKISELAKQVQPFYRQALIMQKVAMFYNNMSDRILKCQKPMLIQAALEFEQCVKQSRNLNQKNASTVLANLQQSLSSIMEKNDQLLHEHEILIKKILGLQNVDIVQGKNLWRSSIVDIRTRFSEFVSQGYSESQFWGLHLDSQIYKILQFQFKSSILLVVERSAQIKVDLVFLENHLSFRPSLEEIRRSYYQSISDIIIFPTKFKGISNDSSFFAPISKSAPDEIYFVYQKGEKLIRQIYEYQFQFSEWTILAENLSEIEERVKSITNSSDWKSNISLVSLRRANISDIQDSVIIGCFILDVSQAKEGFRRLLSQFQIILIRCLKQTLTDEFSSISEFVDECSKVLNVQFDTPQALAECRKKFEDLVRKKVETDVVFTSISEKIYLVQQFDTVVEEATQFEAIQAKWDEVTNQIGGFDEKVAEQFEEVKKKVRGDYEEVLTGIHNFKLMWDELKPKNLDYDDESVVVTVPVTLSKFKSQSEELRNKFEEVSKILLDFDENCEDTELIEFEIEYEECEKSINLLVQWREKFTEFGTQKWITASKKLYLIEDFLNQWSSTLSQSETSDVVLYLNLKIQSYKATYPCLKFLKGDDWTDEHWQAFYRLVGLPSTTQYLELTITDLLEVGDRINQCLKQIKDIAERARGEMTIRSSLEEIRSWFSNTEFQWYDHTFSSRTTSVVKEWKKLLSDLSDKQSLISSLRDSPFAKGFIEDISLWDSKSISLTTNLSLLNDIQRRWLHLEPVFVKKTLPEHQASFDAVDFEFRKILKDLKDSKRAAYAAEFDSENLNKILQKLDQLNRVLNAFLEKKRDSFSRFYFIGDEDLLEIIGLASEDATVVQAHLKKLFQGVHSVKFDSSNSTILAVCSSMGEVVKLKNPIKCQGLVEEWLTALSNEISNTLQQILKEMIDAKPTDLFTYPSQLSLLYRQIEFTSIAESNPSQIKKYVETYLHQLVSMDCRNEIQKYLSRSLIIEFVRFRMVVNELVDGQIWPWLKQLRFYFKSGLASASMGDATIPYGYEYQGNPARLVYTPLTAKCYLTLCEGIALGYGGNPYGPAGTGKTESVKALGQALGRQVLVFNCDEAIDVQSMCRIFTGLVMGGSWGCFDEFNRLDEEVLSAISQQIQVIQAAILNRSPSVEMLGRIIKVNHDAGIYVTLNPAGKGYGGRSKLPSNLTQLFRAVAMSAPDQELIAEVLMYSQGFHCAEEFSKKMVLAFSLCKQLLSPEIHYDWGLRALKSILSTAGQWLDNSEGDVNEKALLVKALRVSTLSKLTYSDRRAFEQIVTDCFPGVESQKVEEYELRKAASLSISEKKLVELPYHVEKMLQMWKAINQRTGVVIVGPSGCGKSTLWSLLHASLAKIGVQVNLSIINPKSMSRQSLLGRVDYDTREWNDGVLTKAARQAVASSNRTWVVCDGDIDPEWIESLNSLLDDNRLLTLPNGERIQFDEKVNFIFETHSLEHASPATVSRMAVLLLSPEELSIQNVCSGWLSQFPSDSRIHYLMTNIFYRAVEILLSHSNKFVLASTHFGIVQTTLSHLSQIDNINDVSFLLSLIRGSTAILEPDQKAGFATYLYKNSQKLNLSLTGINSDTLLDQYWSKGSVHIFDFQPVTPIIPPLNSSRLPLVQTTEVQQTIHTIRPWIEKSEPVLLVGPSGSGKTTLLNYIFQNLPSTTIIRICCSAQTNASTVISKISQNCTIISTAKGSVLRPKGSERALVFLQNFDLPRADKWGTIQLVEFLRQLITSKGFYNESLQWINIEKIQFVFAMSAAEKRPMSIRFTSIVRICSMHSTSPEQLNSIYTPFLSKILQKQHIPDSICPQLVRIFTSIQSQFKVEDYPHYQFTYRDLTRWVVNLQRYAHDGFHSSAILFESFQHFRDRIVNPVDRSRVLKEMTTILRDSIQLPDTEPIFTNLAVKGNEKAPQLLNPTDSKMLGSAVQKLIVSFEREMGHLPVYRSSDIDYLVNKIASLFALPESNIVCITVPGFSILDIIQIICHSTGIEIFSPYLVADFNFSNFVSFIKETVSKVIQSNEEIIMTVEDFIFDDRKILDILNSLMSSGELPGIFSQAEYDSLVSAVASELKESNLQMTNQEFLGYKLKRNIHVVVVLNPQHPSFRSLFDYAPAFVSDATIIWATQFSQETLASIPRQILSNPNDQSSSESLEKIIPLFLNLYMSLDEPPIRYSNFISIYSEIYTFKLESLTSKKKYLDLGLAKLGDASSTVSFLQKDIGEKQIALSEKEKLAKAAMEKIRHSVAKCSEQQSKIESMQKELSVEEDKLKIEQRKIDAELEQIQPAIDAAKELVGQIRRDQLAEVRGFANPPPAVADVMQGVLLMLGETDSSWVGIKKVLAQNDFTARIMNFQANSLTSDTVSRVQKLIRQKASSFEFDIINKASKAVAPLSQWVQANLKYFQVLEKVEPLRRESDAVHKKISSMKSNVQELQQKKSVIDKQVDEHQEHFQVCTQEAEVLKNDLARAEKNLADAKVLFGKLKGEQDRWNDQKAQIVTSLNKLTKDSIIVSAIAAFCGPYPEDERRKMVLKWLPILGGKSDSRISLGRFMYSESELLSLRGSLSGDSLSIENAAIIVNTTIVPLIIDPSQKVVDWITTYFEKKEMQATVLQRTHERFSSQLEQAVRFGKVLIVTEIDSIDPILIPLVRKDFIFTGSHPAVRVGDREIDYNDNFKLYLVTRDPQPRLHPSAAAFVSIINFSITRSGLESTLLSLTLEKELPEDQQERSSLIAQEEKMKLELAQLESDLLQTLVKADSANILSNYNLIETLNRTKTQAAEVTQSLARIEAISKTLDEKANTYRSLAKLAASLYFSMVDLYKLNHMYRFSSTLYMNLFSQTFDIPMNAVGEHRVHKFEAELTKIVFSHISISLFNTHRVAAALHLIQSCYPDIISERELEMLLSESSAQGNCPSWVPVDRQQAFLRFCKSLPELNQALKFSDSRFESTWSQWLNQSKPEENWPTIEGQPLSKRGISPFARLFLISVLVPHRFSTAAEAFSAETLMLKQFSQPFQYDSIATDRSQTPYIFIVSPGADPSVEIRDIANKTKHKLIEIAVGQSEAKVDCVNNAASEGSWLLIKNAHLSISLITKIEKVVSSLQNPAPGFKLLMTTESHNNFPPLLLSNSIKIAVEAPPGLKANLTRTISSMNNSYSQAQIRFIAGLSYFHSVIQERRNYIPQGWTKFYEFSTSDFNCALSIIESAKEFTLSQLEYSQWKKGVTREKRG
jgi:dynein heavy chain 2